MLIIIIISITAICSGCASTQSFTLSADTMHMYNPHIEYTDSIILQKLF